MEARGHAIVLFSAALDRGWVGVSLLLPAGQRAVSPTVLAEEQLPAVPATTRPAEPASPCPASLKVSFLHQGCSVLERPKAGANSGKPGACQVLDEHRHSAPPSSHRTDSDTLGIVRSHEKFGMLMTQMLLHASAQPHKRRAAGTPRNVTD